ncbi:MAG TPA: hypothetical protein VNE21_01605, partial [Mycobacteriales bacterium]|nr:hypothetical protein [Mycobacteriales bacterium]
MARPVRRGFAALALATGGTLMAAAVAAPALATAASVPAVYNASTTASMFGLSLNLPAPVGPLPKKLTLDLISVAGQGVRNTLSTGTPTMSQASASLASGSLIDSLDAVAGNIGLKKTVTATLANPRASDAFANLNAGVLSAQVGPLLANVSRATDGNSSSAAVTNLKVLNVADLLPASATLTSVLNQLQSVINQAQLSQTVSAVENGGALPTGTQVPQGGLNGIIQNVTGSTPVGSVANQTAQQVEAALNSVLATVKNIVSSVTNLGNTSLLTVHTLSSVQNLGPDANNTPTAYADSNLIGLNLLNGLVTVDGFDSWAKATTLGTPGSAVATFAGHTPILHVGTPILSATIDQNGVSLQNVAGLPSSVTDTVNQVLSTLSTVLNGLLKTLGVTPSFTPGHATYNANRSAATAYGPTYDIAVANAVTGPLADIRLGDNVTASIAAGLAPAAPLVITPDTNPKTTLPHTGANLGLTAGIGLALL